MFKKAIVSILIGTVSMSTFAAQDIYLTFNDGRVAVYKNLPDSIDNTQFATMLMRDYGKDFNTDIDLSKSRVVDVPDVINIKSTVVTPANNIQQEVQTGFWDSTAGKVVKWTAIALVGYAIIKALPAVGNVGCVLPTDRAKDGSLCGGRASSVRPGGR